MCENKDKKLNISCFTACFEQKGKHLNLWASAFKPPGKSFLHAGQPFRRNRRNIAIGKSERVNNLSTRSLKASQRQIINFKKRYTTMKRQPLSMLALASLLILSSCGQTAGVKTAGAQQATGEIIASSETAVAQTESGKVGGFLQDGIYIYKGIPYAKAERFMPPQPADKWEGVRSSRMFGPTCLYSLLHFQRFVKCFFTFFRKVFSSLFFQAASSKQLSYNNILISSCQLLFLIFL